MIVPPNVRTQRRLFLPDRERGGEGRQYARILPHLFSRRKRGQICSQLGLICAELRASSSSIIISSSSYGLTAPLDERGREREKEGGATPNAALLVKRAHIFRPERDASSDHTASVRGDVRAARR